MRIIVASSFYYQRGGDSRHFLDVCTELQRRGHEVAVFAMHHPSSLPSPWTEFWAPHVEFRGAMAPSDKLRAAWRSVYSPESGRQMARFIREFRPDLVHFHSVHHHLTLAAVDACTHSATPTVWTLHDHRTVCPATLLLRRGRVCERCCGGRFWHGLVGRCKSGQLARSAAAVAESYVSSARRSLERVDCYLAPSRFLARKVLEMGLPARRIEVHPHPVPVPSLSRRTPRRGSLLYVGRLSSEKGVDHLIRAVSRLDGVSLRILGDGPDRRRLLELASDVGASVVFEGWVDSDSVRTRMREAELLCVPSICYEASGLVALEAMAIGLPVVASNLGGLGELLHGARTGWLAPPGNAEGWCRVLRRALAEEPETSARAIAALERVRADHDPKTCFDRLEAAYESAVQ